MRPNQAIKYADFVRRISFHLAAYGGRWVRKERACSHWQKP